MPKAHIKVLLIEDEPAHLRLIRRYLSCVPDQAIVLVHVSSLSEALKKLSAQHDVDVILTDLGLPDSPTHEQTLAPILRAAPNTPVIVLTALNSIELSLQAVENGAQDYLPKDQLSSELLLRSIQYAIYRKHSERQLRQINDTLEHRVAERTEVAERRLAQLRLLASELAETEQRERRRLAALLHDSLQQSLVAIKMRMSLLPGASSKEHLTQQVKDIDELLRRAIDESRSLALQLSPPILVDQGLGAALEWLGNRVKEEYGLPVEVQVCKTPSSLPLETSSFLFQSVRELLFNAVKYAEADRAIVVMERPESNQLRISVIDEGKGFDPRTLDRPQQSSEHFGLFSVRQRLQLIGGNLQVHSAPGEGTRATMELTLTSSGDDSVDVWPADIVETNRTPGRSRSRVGNTCRVVLIDDHRMVREGIRGMLSEVADILVVGEAADGEEAIRVVRECMPDVAVMDITMPKMTGIEATREIARLFPEVQVIGLSMYPQDQMGEAMIEAGAAAYLPKDGPTDDLVSTIRGLAFTSDAGRSADAHAG